MAWGKINLTASAGITSDIRVTSYATSGDIPASGNDSYVDFAIVSSVSCPSASSGGIVFAPVLSSPTTRLDGSAFQDGDCILSYASAGNTTVNINNLFKIRIIGISQRQSGSFVSVAAKVSDHGAAFVDVNLWLYYLGNEFASLTGGWTQSPTNYSTKNADNILISASSAVAAAAVYTGNSIDVTDLTTMHIVSKRDSARTNAAFAGITASVGTSTYGYNEKLASSDLASSTTQTETIISVAAISGLVKVCFWTISGTARGSYVYKVWFS